MGITRLSKKCKLCPFVDKSEHKQLEDMSYLNEAGQSASMSAAAPLLRETMEINVGGNVITVYKDEIEKELYKHLGVGLMRNGG